MKQVIITTDIQKLRPAYGGHFGEGIRRYQTIRSVFSQRNEHLTFAEPVREGHDFSKISWHTELEGEPVPFPQLPPIVGDRARKVLRYYLDQMYATCQRFDDPRALCRHLDAFLEIPSFDSVFLVDKRPVLTDWGFHLDNNSPDGKGILHRLRESIPAPELIIRLQLVDAAQRQPIGGAKVELNFAGQRRYATSNTDGMVSFEKITPFDFPRFELRVEAAGFRETERELSYEMSVAEMIFSGLTTFENQLVLPAGAAATLSSVPPPPVFEQIELRVRVRDASNGLPLPDVAVSVSPAASARSEGLSSSSGAEGFAQFQMPAQWSHDKLAVYATLDGFGEERLEIEPPIPPEIVVRLRSIADGGFRGQRGQLSVNLRWTTIDDLDLHVFDPFDNEISFSEREVTHGDSRAQLDVDANPDDDDLIEDPQENIFWEKPYSGTYTISVVNFRHRTEQAVPFEVTVMRGNEQLKFSGLVQHQDDFWETTFDF